MSRLFVAAYFGVPPLALATIATTVTRHELSVSLTERHWPRVSPRLPASAMCVTWNGCESSGTAPLDGRLFAVVTFTNCSDRVWPDLTWAGPSDLFGMHAVRIGARWKQGPNRWETWSWRADLPHAVMPGASVRVPLYVPVPGARGRYLLELRMAQESVGWFAGEKANTLTVPVEVR